MFQGFPMFPGPVPTCQIQWIDCKGEPTPDENPAVGLAVIVQQGERKAFPVCKDHARHMLERMPRARCHHDPDCHHVSRGPLADWTFEPYSQG
jgi:hypothetical protein